LEIINFITPKIDFAQEYSSRYIECEIFLEASGTESPVLESFEIFYMKLSAEISKGILLY